MNFKQSILILVLVLFNVSLTIAQNNSSSHKANIEIPEVALLGLVSTGSSNISLQTSSPVEAGNSIDFSDAGRSENLWINYTSVIRNSSHRRKIVAFVQGNIPIGVQIKVEASEATGTGKGKRGLSRGTVTLSDQPSEIITDIGSCYTGTGASNGHFLTYKLEYDDSSDNYSQLAHAETSLSVVYTFTDLN